MKRSLVILAVLLSVSVFSIDLFAGTNCGKPVVALKTTYDAYKPLDPSSPYLSSDHETHYVDTASWAKNYVPEVNYPATKEVNGVIYHDGTYHTDTYRVDIHLTTYHDFPEASKNYYRLNASLTKITESKTRRLWEVTKKVQSDRLDDLIPDLKYLFDNMKTLLLATELPTKVELGFEPQVIDAEDTENVVVTIKKIYDRDGLVSTITDRHPFFCLQIKPEKGTFIGGDVLTERDSIGNVSTNPKDKLTYVTKDLRDECKKTDIYKCNYPKGKFSVFVQKAFNKTINQKVGDDHFIDVDCKIKIVTNPQTSITYGSPEEVRLLALGYDHTPIKGVDLFLTLHPPGLANLSHTKVVTDNNGFSNQATVLLTRDNIPEGTIIYVDSFLCKGTNREFLGTQEYKVTKLPKIRVKVSSVFKINKNIDRKRYGDKDYRHKTEKFNLNGKASLEFDVQFKRRRVQPHVDSHHNFKGKVVVYEGEAKNVSPSLSMSNPAVETHFIDGYFTEYECGKIPYEYLDHQINHSITRTFPSVSLDVYYWHYIPDPGTPNVKLPTEGLYYMSKAPYNSSFSYMASVKGRKMNYESGSCIVSYTGSTSPVFPVPIVITNSGFPLLLWQTFRTACYGVEDFINQMQNNEMRDFFRKVKADGKSFDSLHYSQDINLGKGDVKECWDLNDSGFQENEGRVTGKVTLDSEVEVLKGKFDF